MNVYIIGTSLSVLFAYIATHISGTKQLKNSSKKALKRIFVFLSFLPLTFIMAVRYGVGTDFFSYQRIFLYGYGGKNKEAGYITFQNLLKIISENPQIVIIASSIIICIGYFLLFYRESINPAYSILLFVINKDYFMSMNGLRQYLATAIVLFAVPSMREKKWKNVLIALILAFSIHRSSIIFLLLFLLYLLDIRPGVGVAAIIGTFAVSNTVFRIIAPLMSRWGYSYFFYGSVYYNKFGNFEYTYAAIYGCFFILLCYVFKIVRKSDSLKLMYSAVLLNLMMVALTSVMPTNFHWLMFHLNSILAAYTPQLTTSVQNKAFRWLINVIIVVAYIALTVPSILNGNQGVLPYQTFWSR